MFRKLLQFCGGLAFTLAVWSAPAHGMGPTSAYTKLDLDRCPIIEQNEEEAGWTVWRCTGYQGRPVFVFYGDERFSIGLRRDAQWYSLAPFNSLGTTLEWRLDANGAPYATIIRYHTYLDGNREGQVLVVSQLYPQACPVAYVDARTNPGANQLARNAADSLAGAFDCDAEQPGDWGNPGWSRGGY